MSVNFRAGFVTDCHKNLVNVVAILRHGVQELPYGWLGRPNEYRGNSHNPTNTHIQHSPQILFHGVRANSHHENYRDGDLDLPANREREQSSNDK